MHLPDLAKLQLTTEARTRYHTDDPELAKEYPDFRKANASIDRLFPNNSYEGGTLQAPQHPSDDELVLLATVQPGELFEDSVTDTYLNHTDYHGKESDKEFLSDNLVADGPNGYLVWIHEHMPYVGCDLLALQILQRERSLDANFTTGIDRTIDPTAFLMSYAKVQAYRSYMDKRALGFSPQHSVYGVDKTLKDTYQEAAMRYGSHALARIVDDHTAADLYLQSAMGVVLYTLGKRRYGYTKMASFPAFDAVSFTKYPEGSQRRIPFTYREKRDAACFYINAFAQHLLDKNLIGDTDIEGVFDAFFPTTFFHRYVNKPRLGLRWKWHDHFWNLVLDNKEVAEKAVKLDGEYLFYCSERVARDTKLRIIASETSIWWAFAVCSDMLFDLGEDRSWMKRVVKVARSTRFGVNLFGPATPTLTDASVAQSYRNATKRMLEKYSLTEEERETARPELIAQVNQLTALIERVVMVLEHPDGVLFSISKRKFEEEGGAETSLTRDSELEERRKRQKADGVGAALKARTHVSSMHVHWDVHIHNSSTE